MFKFDATKVASKANVTNLVRKSGIYDMKLTNVIYSDLYGGAFDVEGETSDGFISCKVFLFKRDGNESFGMFVMNSILGVLGVNEIKNGSELNGRDIKIALKVTNKMDGDKIKFSQHSIIAVFNLDGKEYNEIVGDKPATKINSFNEIETVEEKMAPKASFKAPVTVTSTVNVPKPEVKAEIDEDALPF